VKQHGYDAGVAGALAEPLGLDAKARFVISSRRRPLPARSSQEKRHPADPRSRSIADAHWISAIVPGNCHKVIFTWRLNDGLQSTRHLFKSGQSLIPASLDAPQSFVKFLSGHGISAFLAFGIGPRQQDRGLPRRYPRRLRINPRSESMPFHTPPSAEVAGYAGFALFEALSDLLIIKDVLTRNEVDELLARTASRLQTSPDEVGRRTADFVRQLGEQ
jgi:hypothetical protein